MPRKDYKTVTFPRELLDAIQELIERFPALARNPSEYIIHAARSKYLEDLKLVRMGVVVRPPEGDHPPEG